MNELQELLNTPWGAEPWILEGWQQLTVAERADVTHRIQQLFKQRLPFTMQYERIHYLYVFALLAQLEVLAIQIPLKFATKVDDPLFRQQLHAQLLDEVFHGLVFTKITYLLAEPYAMPPAYNATIEDFCNFIRAEECPKMALVLLNLVAEGWIEELFHQLKQHGIAPVVFDVILADEHRHVNDADLYCAVGLPDPILMQQKIVELEKHLLNMLWSQYKYANAFAGLQMNAYELLLAIDKKHRRQLKKINLSPGEKWCQHVLTCKRIITTPEKHPNPIAMTPTRQFFMTQWSAPSDPTMVAEFNLDVSCLDFFQKKYSSETVTLLLLQTISLMLAEEDKLRRYLQYGQIYQAQHAYTALVVHLPTCGDSLSHIVFENCHLLSLPALSAKLQQSIQAQVECWHQRHQLEQQYPHLQQVVQQNFHTIMNDQYPRIVPPYPIVSMSNIGRYGYTQGKSPLLANEALKFLLMAIERRPAWNNTTMCFEPTDILPISLSADHRLLDGNISIPTLFKPAFLSMFQQLNTPSLEPTTKAPMHNMQWLQDLITSDLNAGYAALNVLQTIWFDQSFSLS